MSNQSPHVVRSVEGCWEVRFDGFADLPAERRDEFSSQRFACLGHEWSVNIYPGGDEESSDGMVQVDIFRKASPEAVVVYLSLRVRNTDGMEIFHEIPRHEYKGYTGWGVIGSGRTIRDFAPRSQLLRSLVEGALIIEVRMKLLRATDAAPLPLVIENPAGKHLLRKFEDEEFSDVVFQVRKVSGRGNGHVPKRAKASPILFHAHRLVLKDAAPMLYELCKSGGEFAIDDVAPCIFRQVLYYMYGGKVSDEAFASDAKNIIDAADRYGVVHLKLEAEARYVRSTAMTLDNVMDELLYADAKNCALLKEAAIDFLVDQGHEAAERLSFDDAPGHLMKDLLVAVSARDRGRGGPNSDASDISTMRVNALRRMLRDKGLDIDGSREMMVARLREHS